LVGPDSVALEEVFGRFFALLYPVGFGTNLPVSGQSGDMLFLFGF
jgi:hypothetical protein